MRIPHTIEKSTAVTYGVVVEDQQGQGEELGYQVAPLAEICTSSLPAKLLPVLPPYSQNYMLETLPTNLPLQIATKAIPSGIYWKRRTEERWKTANDVQDAGGDWKRYFLERHTQELLETLSPNDYTVTLLEDLCEMVSDHVERLELKQLQVKSELLDSEAGEEELLHYACDRINLKPLLIGLQNLVELHIQFCVRDLGTNYRTIFFEFTNQDCRNLGDGISQAGKLRLLRIHQSALNDSKVMTLLSHMQANTSLECLLFPHCQIGDEGAAAIAKFISDKPKFRKLDISNNKIKKLGIQALSFVLTQQNGSGLMYLNVSLNHFGDEGAQFLLSALQRQAPALRIVNISCAGLGEDSGILLGEVLTRNKCLVDLNLSSNPIGAAAGRAILKGMENNSSLQFCDLRMTGMSDEDEAAMQILLHRNRCRDRTHSIVG